ncbi:MAG: hydrogenase 3 maturation endopeptidase HyCI [Candidatus Omnitrophota bacterium]
MQNKLKDILKGKVVIVGIGNIIRGDDGFGPALINKIKDETRAVCIDAGSAPENYIGKIIKEKPDTVLIIDAVYLGRNPGEYEILEEEDIVKCGFTTHDISPAMFMECLTKETEADIYMFGVQPKTIELGSELSLSLRQTLREVARLIRESFNA